MIAETPGYQSVRAYGHAMPVIPGRRNDALPIHRRSRLVVASLAPLALVLGPAGSAVADPPDYTLTVGIPAGESPAATIDNRLASGGGQVLTEQLLGLGDPTDYSHSRFGAAMLVQDLDVDGFDDLVVGAPSTPHPGLQRAPGTVYLLFGTSTGISAARAVTLPVPSEVQDGDEFGAALSLTFRTTEDDSISEFRDLWIGAPGHDVAGRSDAGAVYRYTLSSAGVPAFVEAINQDSPLLPGAAEAGDRFGEVLAASAGNALIVGVPHEDVGRAQDAGIVQQLRIDPVSYALIAGSGWSQNNAGVAGTAEAGDRFGASMTENAAVVGVPGEDLGRLQDAGAVQLFTVTPKSWLAPSSTYNQDSRGIPGVAEAGDRFGAAVQIGAYQCESDAVAVGAPGEDIGSAKNAGSVTLAPPLSSDVTRKDCPATMFSQGHGLPGAAETGDELGTALGELPGDVNDEESMRDVLLAGIPGEDVGTTATGRDVGRVVVGIGGISRPGRGYGFQRGDVENLRYGSYFPSR